MWEGGNVIFIRFRDFSTGNWLYGFLVAADDTSISYIDPHCHRWLCLIGREDAFSQVIPKRFHLSLDVIQPESFQYEPPLSPVVAGFPLDDAGIREADHLIEFFRYACVSDHSLSLEQLERAIVRCAHLFDNQDVLHQAVRYLLVRFPFEKERLRLFTYPRVLAHYHRMQKAS